MAKLDVETRFDFVLFELSGLIGDELTLFDCFLRHIQYRLGLQHSEVSVIDREENLRPRGNHIFLLGLCVQVRAFHQLVRTAEVGDQLVYHDAVGFALVDDGVVQRAGRNPAVVFRIDRRDAAIGGRIVCGALLGDLRFRGGGHVQSGLNLRMIFEWRFARRRAG